MGIKSQQIMPIQLPEKSVRAELQPSDCSLRFRNDSPSKKENYDCVFTQIEFTDGKPSVNEFVHLIVKETERHLPTAKQLEDGFFIDYSQLPTIIYIASAYDISDPPHLLEQNLMSSLLIAVLEHNSISLWIPTIGSFQHLKFDVQQCLEITLGALNSLTRTLIQKSTSPVSIELSFLPSLPNTKYEALVSEYGKKLGKDGYFDKLEWSVYTDDEFPSHHKLDTQKHLTNDGRATEDLLGHKRISSALATFLKQTDTGSSGTSLPVTIAVDGAWGTGKSSIMGFLSDELQGPVHPRRFQNLTNWFVLAFAFLWLPLFWICGLLTDFLNPIVRTARKLFGFEKPPAQQTYETVWINAWRHGTGDRLKARIVHLIVKQLVERNGWKFLFELNLTRFNKPQLILVLAQRLFTSIITISILVAVGWVLTQIAIDEYYAKNPLSAFRNGLPGGVALLFAWSMLSRRLKNPPEIVFSNFFLRPNYEELVGADMEIEADFERILDVLAKKNRTLALFIDDLDRCSPTEVVEVIESLNVFFGKEDHRCVFILGMHFDMVAASLDVAYKDVQEKIDSDPTLAAQRPFGRRFLEKVVQFSVSVPNPTESDTDKYLEFLAGSSNGDEDQKLIEKAMDDLDQAWKTAGRVKDVDIELRNIKVGLELSTDNPDILDQFEQEIEFRKRMGRANILSEADPDVLLIFKSLRFALQNNPRQYKRFFNRFRFRNYVEQALISESAGRYEDSLLNAAKTVVLELEFPEVARWLSENGYTAADLPKIAFSLIFDKAENDTYGLTKAAPNTLEEIVLNCFRNETNFDLLANLAWDQILEHQSP